MNCREPSVAGAMSIGRMARAPEAAAVRQEGETGTGSWANGGERRGDTVNSEPDAPDLRAALRALAVRSRQRRSTRLSRSKDDLLTTQ
jgi:hypothetical protein